jgi:hypothetical protein
MPLDDDPLLPDTLIIVCCHAIYHGGPAGDATDARNWLLQPFQRGSGTKESEHLTFLRHIERALRFLRRPSAAHVQGQGEGGGRGPRTLPLVVFSGGHTNRAAAPGLSEARGYLDAAHGLLAMSRSLRPSSLSSRSAPASHSGLGLDLRDLRDVDAAALDVDVALEEHATDTLQNILFGICRFRDVRGTYPAAVRVVSHAFKQERIEMHRGAVRWTRAFDVIGIDPRWDGKISPIACLSLRFRPSS